jgi:hypothetical protein
MEVNVNKKRGHFITYVEQCQEVGPTPNNGQNP